MMTLFSADSSWFDYQMLVLCNLKNIGHGGFVSKISGFAVRGSLLRLV